MAKNRNIVLQKVMIEDYAAEGKSLARVEGKVVFVEGVVPGDVVDIRLYKNKKDWGEGSAILFHAYSPDRVIPFCQHFGVCGGCQWQMLPYEKQLHYKQQQVNETLKRIGKVELPAVRPILGAAETRFYRNKLEYTFGTREFTAHPPPSRREGAPQYKTQLVEKPKSFDPSGSVGLQSPSFGGGNAGLPLTPSGGGGAANAQAGLKQNTENSDNTSTSKGSALMASPFGGGREGALGFHPKGFFDKVVDIQTCWLQPEPTNAIRLAVRKFAKENGFSFYDIREHHGLLRTMQVRICTTGEVMVNIIFGEDDEKKRVRLLEFVKKLFPSISTLLYTINTKKNDSINDLEPFVYYGKGYVIEKLEDFEFKIGPKSFFQTNTKQAERLYQVVRNFAELTGKEIVYDLYCGTGSIGIFVSKQAKKIIGVEVTMAAVEDSRENAARNNVFHAEFLPGDVIKVCDGDFFAAHGKPDVIITDPPRAGMHEKLVKKILEMEAPVIVNVSCNPATQARDINILNEKYSVTKIQPVDMFPHTLHIENVVQLKLRM